MAPIMTGENGKILLWDSDYRTTEIKHLTPSEIPHMDRVNPLAVLALDQTREAAGVQVIVHYIFDPDGHSPRSRHYVTEDRPKADAVDFHFGGGLTPPQELAVVMGMGPWGGIGYYPHWSPRPGWHVDLRPAKSNGQRTLWWRDAKGEYHYGWRALLEGVALAEGRVA